MKSQVTRAITIITSLLILTPCWNCCGKELILNNTPVQVYFSPEGGCTKAIVNEIDSAKSEVLVQAYSFTSRAIAKALLAAHKRGIDVEVILDGTQVAEKYNPAKFLTHSGIPAFVDGQHTIAHNKIMIIDRNTVITGSFNFTNAAEHKNAENLIIIKSRKLAELYLENWKNHRKHSEQYRTLN